MDTFDQASFRRMLKEVLLEVARDVFALRPAALVRPDPNAPAGVEKLLLRPSEAAKALAISERHLSKLCIAGKIPCVRITRLVRYDPVVLREWIKLPESARMLDKLRDPPPRGVKAETESRSTPSAAPPQTKARKPREAKTPSPPRPRKPVVTPEVTPKPRIAAEYFAQQLGVSANRFPTMTNGDLIRASFIRGKACVTDGGRRRA
jgi:hypothetical protein